MKCIGKVILYTAIQMLFFLQLNAQIISNLGNTGPNSGWHVIGTLTLPQQGADAVINIAAGAGYNAVYQQNGLCVIHFRTSNGTSSNNNFLASGTYFNLGHSKIVSALKVEQISDNIWKFYASLPFYTGDYAVLSVSSSTGVWSSNFYRADPPINVIISDLKEELVLTSDFYSMANVGIGTISPQEKLSVNGNIRAKEIKVEAINWPDYVFEEDYKRSSLFEIEKFIKTNKRLPEMPSAKSLEGTGLSVGEMFKLQQKKIEELTLHLIDQQKEINKLKKNFQGLKNKL